MEKLLSWIPSFVFSTLVVICVALHNPNFAISFFTVPVITGLFAKV